MAEYERVKLTGCTGLWAAVLFQAVDDYRAWGDSPYVSRQKRLIGYQAETWLRSESTEMPAFLWVCLVLGLDPEAVRKKILKGVKKTEKKDTDKITAIGLLPRKTRESNNPIGRLIQSYRRRHSITQREMARRVGCPRGVIGQFEARPDYGRTGSRYIPIIEDLVNGE